MTDLRKCAIDDLVPANHPQRREIAKIQDTAGANDSALRRLCELKPQHTESYRRQWDQAEADLARRLRKAWRT